MSRYPPLFLMHLSGTILKNTFEALSSKIVAGVSTLDLDKVAENFILDAEALPIFKGYNGFPTASCISVNDCAVHGVPSKDVILSLGDMVSIDCGVSFKGAITDACRTFFVGPPSIPNKFLADTTDLALSEGIKKAIPGNRIGDISYAIQKTVETARFNVARDFTGHAVGFQLHMPPWIPSYGVPNTGPTITAGMFIAIEPVVFAGSWEYYTKGEWAAHSVDGKNVAHFEDTLYISENGPVVLTR